MNKGAVELRSGTWDWRLRAATMGSIVEFSSRTAMGEQMQTWIPDRSVLGEMSKEVALDPVYRTWRDPEGRTWRVRQEEMRRPISTSDPDTRGSEPVLLVFTRGDYQLDVMIERRTRLGALTAQELGELFRAAVPWH